MKKIVPFIFAGFMPLFLFALPVAASSSHGSMEHGTGTQSHSSMTRNMGYKQVTVVDGIRSEFQIMSLASMNMKDENGATHHIMVKLIDDKTQAEIKAAVGKIKIIKPNGQEQENSLKNYNGILAANFSFETKGKYGVICLYKVGDQKRVVKFWYNHKG